MDYALINTIIASIVAAFLFGMVAKQLKLPAVLGYLLAGVAIGPHTPGLIADLSLAKQLAEIGIILLMFGVGLHFSLKDLFESRKIALPGAVMQIFSATLVGGMVGLWLGHDMTASFIFGFSLSVASTIVLIRSLEQRKLLESKGGKFAISWLIMEDIAMVFALVMLPALAQINDSSKEISVVDIAMTVLEVFFKISGFFVFMVVVGRKLLPWVLAKVTKIGSEELNTLGSLAIALGFAMIAYRIFDASLALGAFLAGVMLNESEIGRKSADSSMQMRDTFSVLFFVSIGMLFNPSTLIEQPLAVALTFMTIVVAKSGAALIITRWFNQPWNVSYPVAIGLAQIGEFSFILSGLALARGLITHDLYDLVLAGAMLSIIANPFLFRLYDWRVVRAK